MNISLDIFGRNSLSIIIFRDGCWNESIGEVLGVEDSSWGKRELVLQILVDWRKWWLLLEANL